MYVIKCFENAAVRSVLLLAGHVSHQVVDKLVHLLDVLGEVRLVLEAHHVVRHLDHEAALAVVILCAVSHLHWILEVKPLCRLLKLLPTLNKRHLQINSERWKLKLTEELGNKTFKIINITAALICGFFVSKNSTRGDSIEHVSELAHPLGDHPSSVALVVDEAGVDVRAHEQELQSLLVVGLTGEVEWGLAPLHNSDLRDFHEY